MGIERINPESVYAPPTEGYSQVVTASGDTQVHLSGMVGMTPDGDLVGEDMLAQTRQALENVSRALAAVGADESDVVRVRILTTDAAEFLDRCKESVVEWYGEHGPAETMHEVGGLAVDALKVEIEVTAVLEE